MSPQNILIIQLRQLGDILLTTPCLRAIKEQYPHSRLVFLSHPMGRGILEEHPFCDEHLSYDSSATLGASFNFLRKLRKYRFDLIFDFMGNPRSTLYALATRAPRRYGFKSVRSLAYTHSLARQQGAAYTVGDKFRLLEHAGIHANNTEIVLNWGPTHLGASAPLRSLPAFRAASLRVAIAPTHRHSVRRWPLENYAELSDRLVRDKKAAVVFTCAPGEEEYITQLQALTKEVNYRCPPLNLKELTAFFSTVDLFIGNSNGASHFAVASGTRSLQLHGPTNAKDWCPFTTTHRALQAPLHMHELEVDTVWNTLSNWIF